jgi:hypothetical protein
MGADGGEMSPSSLEATPMERPMPQQLDDLSRSLTPLEQDSTIIAVIEMGQASWLVAGLVPGVERHPLKKLEPSEVELLRLLIRWRAEATQKGRTITRIAVAFEAGRDGFWLARWLRARGIEAYVIHPTSVAVSREHRRAKTDRLDTGLLKRVFIRTSPTSWFIFSPASWALALRQQTCWSMRCLPGPGAIEELSPAMRA